MLNLPKRSNLFLTIYSLIERQSYRKEQRFSICDFTAQTESRSLELHLGLPYRWHDPKHSGHLHWFTKLVSRELDRKHSRWIQLVILWDSHVTGCGLTHKVSPQEICFK